MFLRRADPILHSCLGSATSINEELLSLTLLPDSPCFPMGHVSHKPCPSMCHLPQALQTLEKKTSFSPLWLVSVYYSVALGIRVLFCFWPIPLTALKYKLSLRFLSDLVDCEGRERYLLETWITPAVGSFEINCLNAKGRRVSACPSWLYLPAMCDTRLLAFNPIHNICSSPLCRWGCPSVIIKSTPSSVLPLLPWCTKRLISQGFAMDQMTYSRN